MQELEKILEDIDQEVKEYMEIDFGDEYNAGIKDMAKIAKKIIRKHMNDGWISVEERIPAEGEEVLITTDVGLIATGYIHCCEWITGVEPDYPIAWRPLPEPYRPDQERSVE